MQEWVGPRSDLRILPFWLCPEQLPWPGDCRGVTSLPGAAAESSCWEDSQACYDQPSPMLPAGPTLRGPFRAHPPSGCLPHPSCSSWPGGLVSWSPCSGVPLPFGTPAVLNLPHPDCVCPFHPTPPPTPAGFSGFCGNKTKVSLRGEGQTPTIVLPEFTVAELSGPARPFSPESSWRAWQKLSCPRCRSPSEGAFAEERLGPRTSPTCSADSGSPRSCCLPARPPLSLLRLTDTLWGGRVQNKYINS